MVLIATEIAGLTDIQLVTTEGQPLRKDHVEYILTAEIQSGPPPPPPPPTTRG